jgi:hypothetical protein
MKAMRRGGTIAYGLDVVAGKEVERDLYASRSARKTSGSGSGRLNCKKPM